MNHDQFLRHPDLFALSAKFWWVQIEEQQQRLSETRRMTAVLVETMCELRDQMQELREQCKRRLVPTRSSSTPRG